MEVWHLLDTGGGAADPATLELLAQSQGRLPDVSQHVVLMGGANAVCRAEQVGLRPAVHLGVPYGHGVLGYAALRRRLRRLPTPDIVHCWSPGTAMLAAVLPQRAARILTLTQRVDAGVARRLRALACGPIAPMTVLTLNATARHALILRGLDARRVHVLRPAVDMARIDRAGRATLRERWEVDDDVTVMALLADPVAVGDACLAVMVASMADFAENVAKTRIRVLLHPATHGRRRAVRWMHEVGHGRRVICDAAVAAPWRVLPGCDVALSSGVGVGGLGLLWAMAAGVPIIAEASDAVGEILEDRHSALLAPPGDPKRLAHRLGRLLSDATLAWKLRDTSRHEAYSLFGRQHYCQCLGTVYAQVGAGETVDVPSPPVTGGMRFMGRA